MVGLFVADWYPSEEKAVMNIPLFTLAASLLTMAFPVLMLLSGKYTAFVPWLTLISAVFIGVALLSTYSQRRVLILHRGVHVGVVYFALAILFAFMEQYSPCRPRIFDSCTRDRAGLHRLPSDHAVNNPAQHTL